MRNEHAQILRAADIPRFAAPRRHRVDRSRRTPRRTCPGWRSGSARPARSAGRVRVAGAAQAAAPAWPTDRTSRSRSPNPMLGFYAAVTRQDREGQPPGGWMPDERLRRGPRPCTASRPAPPMPRTSSRTWDAAAGHAGRPAGALGRHHAGAAGRILTARPLLTIRGGRVTLPRWPLKPDGRCWRGAATLVVALAVLTWQTVRIPGHAPAPRRRRTAAGAGGGGAAGVLGGVPRRPGGLVARAGRRAGHGAAPSSACGLALMTLVRDAARRARLARPRPSSAGPCSTSPPARTGCRRSAPTRVLAGSLRGQPVRGRAAASCRSARRAATS